MTRRWNDRNRAAEWVKENSSLNVEIFEESHAVCAWIPAVSLTLPEQVEPTREGINAFDRACLDEAERSIAILRYLIDAAGEDPVSKPDER